MPTIRISAFVPPSVPANALFKPEKAQRFLVPIDTSRTIGDLFNTIDKRFKENYCKGNAQLANNFFIIKLQDVHGNDLDCLDVVGDIFDESSKQQHQVNVVRGSLGRMSSIPVGSALHPAGYTIPSSSLASFVRSSDPDRPLNDITEGDYSRLNADHPLTSTESAEPAPSESANRHNEDNAASHAAISYSQDLEPNLTDTSQPTQDQNTSPLNSGFRIPALPKRKLANVDPTTSPHATREPSPKRTKPSSGSSGSLLARDQVTTQQIARNSTNPIVPEPTHVHDASSTAIREQARNLSRSPEPRTSDGSAKGPSKLRIPDRVDANTADYRGNTPPGFYVNHVNSPEATAARNQKTSDFPYSTTATLGNTTQTTEPAPLTSVQSNSARSNSSHATPTSSNNLGRTVWTTTKRPTPTAPRTESPGSPACARCKRGKRRCDRDGHAKCLRCRRNGWECWTDAPVDVASSQAASSSSNRSASALSASLTRVDKGKQRAADPFTMSAELARRRASGLFKGVLIREGLPDTASADPTSSQPSPTQRQHASGINDMPAIRRSDESRDGVSRSVAAPVFQTGFQASPTQRLPAIETGNAQSGRDSGGHKGAAAVTVASAASPKLQTSPSQWPANRDINAHALRGSGSDGKGAPGSVDSDRPPARFSPSDGGENTSHESHGTDSDDHSRNDGSSDHHQDYQGAAHQPEARDMKSEAKLTLASSDTVGSQNAESQVNDSKPADKPLGYALDAFSAHWPVSQGSGMDVKYQPARSLASISKIASTHPGNVRAESTRDVKYSSLSSSSSSDEDVEQRSSDEDDPILQSEMRQAIERAGPDAKSGTPGQKRLLRSFNELITSTWQPFSSQSNGERPWYDVPTASPSPKEAITDQAANFIM